MTGLSRVAALRGVVFTLWTKSASKARNAWTIRSNGSGWSILEPLRSDPVLRFSSAVLIDHRDRHHCSVAPEGPFASLIGAKTPCIVQTFLHFEHLPILFSSFRPTSPPSLSPSPGCDGGVSIFTGARSFAFSRVDSPAPPRPPSQPAIFL